MAPQTIVLSVSITLIAACGSSSSNSTGSDASSGPDSSGQQADARPGDVTDFAAPGPFSVTSSQASSTVGACNMSYDLYEPDGASSPPLVILGHGFSRSRAQMVGIAEHIASHGARVAAPDFCHLSAFDSNHPQNGQDAVDLGAELSGGSPVLYAGYSAGGLAAFLAASGNANASGYLGLDFVDADSLADTAAAQLSVPSFAIVGEGSMCNSDNNGVPVLAKAQVTAVRLVGATHCDFEEPTNGLCTNFCGAASGGVATVKALAAAFVAATTGIDSTGSAWIAAGGSEFDRLVAAGTISPL